MTDEALDLDAIRARDADFQRARAKSQPSHGSAWASTDRAALLAALDRTQAENAAHELRLDAHTAGLDVLTAVERANYMRAYRAFLAPTPEGTDR